MDTVYQFSYTAFDKALYIYPSREIHKFMLCSKFIEVYVCEKKAKLLQKQKGTVFWDTVYCYYHVVLCC